MFDPTVCVILKYSQFVVAEGSAYVTAIDVGLTLSALNIGAVPLVDGKSFMKTDSVVVNVFSAVKGML